MSRAEYLALGGQFSVVFDKEAVYECAERYQAWLRKNRLSDINDIAVRAWQNRGEKEYGFLVLDEVQDLTEKEILVLFSLLRNPLNFFLSGDVNQTVHATYFAPHRIHTLLMKSVPGTSGRDYEQMLHLDYRCARPIVDMANRLIDIRKEALRGDKHDQRYDGHDLAVAGRDASRPVLMELALEEKITVLFKASKRHYAAILVSDEEAKAKLAELGLEQNVFTVSEFKGIERDEIICWNLVSDNLREWNIITGRSRNSDVPNPYWLRYHFNRFYVAVTRACSGVLFFEEKVLSN